MSKVAVITSCSAAGWAQYGNRCMGSILIHWPKEVDIYLVSEDKLQLNTLPTCTLKDLHRINYLPLHENEAAHRFYQRHAGNKICKGQRTNTYDFRLDAWRFSKKVFAIELVARMIPTGRLLWLDSDTITMSDIPLEMLQRMPPNEFALAYLARQESYHSECGFVGYNLDHVQTRDFINKFAALYASDEVFKLKEWHDSWVFDWNRKRLATQAHPIPHNNHFSHPFVYSELGQYMDHLKGRRKQLGMSTEHPRFKRRK